MFLYSTISPYGAMPLCFSIDWTIGVSNKTIYDICTVMRRITTFRSTTDRIYDGGPITLYLLFQSALQPKWVMTWSTIVEYSQQEGFYRVPLPAARQTPKLEDQYYNIIIFTTVLQLPTVFSRVTCCTGL